MLTRALGCGLLLMGCTTFTKVDDAGGRDGGELVDVVGQDAPAVDGGIDADEADAGTGDAMLPDAFDAGPQVPCDGLDIGGGVLDPAVVAPGTDDYTITYTFAQLRARLRGTGPGDVTCTDASPIQGNGIELDAEGYFLPVHGGEIEFLGDTFTIQIAEAVLAYGGQGDHQESRFGAAISAEGSLVAIGAPTDRHMLRGAHPGPSGELHDLSLSFQPGAVSIFEIGDEGFEQRAFLQSDEQPFDVSIALGTDVHLRDGLLVASAPNYFVGSAYGQLHMYRSVMSTWAAAGLIPRPDSEGAMDEARTRDGIVYVGFSVLLDPTRSVVRAHSLVDDRWQQTGDDLVAPLNARGFGAEVDIGGDVMLVEETTQADGTRMLHLLTRVDGDWVLSDVMPFTGGLFDTDGEWAAVTDQNGTKIYRVDDGTFQEIGDVGQTSAGMLSISIRQGRLVTGVPEAPLENARTGLVTTFTMAWDGSAVSWVAEYPVRPLEDTVQGGEFGYVVELTDSLGYLVGAPDAKVGGPLFEPGAVFVYR